MTSHQIAASIRYSSPSGEVTSPDISPSRSGGERGEGGRSSAGADDTSHAAGAESMRSRVEEQLERLDKDLDLAVNFAAEVTKSA